MLSNPMPDGSNRRLGCLVAAERPCRKNVPGQISQVSGRARLAAPKRCDVGLMAIVPQSGPKCAGQNFLDIALAVAVFRPQPASALENPLSVATQDLAPRSPSS